MCYTRVSSISIFTLGLLKMQLSGTKLFKILVKVSKCFDQKKWGKKLNYNTLTLDFIFFIFLFEMMLKGIKEGWYIWNETNFEQ